MKRIVSLALVLAFALASCSVTVRDKAGWPSEVRENYMASCTDGTEEFDAFCECSFDALQDEWSYEKFKQMEDAANTDPEVEEELFRVISRCLPDEDSDQ